MLYLGFPHDSILKNLPANAGNTDLIPGLCRGPCEGWKRISKHETEWEGNKVY